jgi:protein TonB
VAQKSLLGLSLLFHGALGVLVYRIDMGRSHAATAIEVADAKKHEAPKPPPEPPKPPPPAPKHVARHAVPAAEKLAAAPPPAAAPLAALPDFGLELSGGVGGLALPQAATGPSVGGSPLAARTQPSVVKHAPVHAAAALDPCDEPAAKPKPVNVPQPAYTDRAREAGVAGKVRVELTVDATGRVVSVRVIQGLGYGLDEAAVAAARSATFEPALRCGKPTSATFTISMRFSAS